MEGIDRIKALLESNLADLRQARQQGRKVVGYTPGGYFPEELALAAGVMPRCLVRGGNHGDVEASLAYIDRWMDTFYRSQIGSALANRDPVYRLIDVLFVPITDSNNRALADTIAYHSDIDVYPYGVPHVKSDLGLGYFLHGLTGVRNKLEQLTGEEITDARLREAITLCNRERELLRRISLMRKAESPPLSSKDFVMINYGAMILDKYDFLACLELLAEELQAAEPLAGSGPRLLLTGSTLAMGDDKVPDLIAEAGGRVVIEDFAEGIKPYWLDVSIAANPLEALARSYFSDRIVPAWFRPATERQEHLIQLAKDFSVDGVIWYQLLYREAYKIDSAYFPELLNKATGLSMLTLESDYDPSETGQMSTRIETYMERLRRRPDEIL